MAKPISINTKYGAVSDTQLKKNILDSDFGILDSNKDGIRNVDPDKTVSDVDFGSQEIPGTIQRILYNDLNGNGIQDEGETGLQNRTVFIDSNKDGIRNEGETATTTSESGHYLFDNVTPGTYSVAQVQEEGWKNTGEAQIVNVDPDKTVSDVDFGSQILPGTIQGILYNDLNGNGIQDEGETGLQGRTVFIDSNNNGILDQGETATTTSESGNYLLDNVTPGTYSVAQVQEEGWKNTGGKVVVEPDNYGDGTVLNNQVPGVTLGENISVKNGQGRASTGSKVFAWGSLRSIFFQGSHAHLNADFDSPVTTVSIDFTNISPNDNIGQLKAYDQAGNLLATDTTRELGRSQTETLTISLNDPSIARIVAGTPNNSNYGLLDNLTFSGGAQIVNVGQGETVSNVDFGSQILPGTIQGILYNDLNGNGIQDEGETGLQGRTVFIDSNNNGILDQGETATTTSESGNYLLDNVTPETHSVAQVQEEGWKNTGEAQIVNVGPDETVSNVDFGSEEIPGIKGILYNDLNGNGIQDEGETGLQGRTVFIDSNNNGILDQGETATTTSESGNYLFDNVTPGTYSVAQVQEEGWKNTGGKVVVEPDNYGDGTVLNNQVPGVTLGENISVKNGQDRASTGSKVFAWGAPSNMFFQGSFAQLHADFDSPVTTVSIDFTNISSTDNIGQLKAYDQAGNLLATDTTRELGRYQTETLTISLDDPSIARIVASTPNNSNYGLLDNLTFSGGTQIVNVGLDETVSNVDFGSQELGHLL